MNAHKLLECTIILVKSNEINTCVTYFIGKF